MIIFHFIFENLENSILKVEWSRIFKNVSTSTKCFILQNGLHVNEILIFLKFKFSGSLKDTYVLSNYGFYNHNISNY
jgi:hypothetical protein